MLYSPSVLPDSQVKIRHICIRDSTTLTLRLLDSMRPPERSPPGKRGGTIAALSARAASVLFVVALLTMAPGSNARRRGQANTLLEAHGPAERISIAQSEPVFDGEWGSMEGAGVAERGLALQSDQAISVRACTTMVIAAFSAACKDYTTSTPGCTINFRQQDTRQLYDCSTVRKTGASSYIDTPPAGLQVRYQLDAHQSH